MFDIYWEYAGTRYKHKLQVINSARGDLHNIKFNVFSEKYFSNDFTKEPSESFDELLKQRALQLRDKYKFIKLYFSGGQDSITMLHAFIKNNIPLDEVIIYRFGSDYNQSNVEADKYAIPYAKKILNGTKTKLSVHENNLDYFNNYLGEKWFFTRSSMSLRHFNLPRIRGNNFCHLFGLLDPKVYFEDGFYYTRLFDTEINELAQYKNVEFFYTSDDFVDLHIKQLHLVKNFIKTSPDRDRILSLYYDDPQTYDDVVKRVCRDDPLFGKLFVKHIYNTVLGDKDKIVYSELDQVLKDKFRYQLSTKINGQYAFRQLIAYETGRICLGQ